MAQISFGTMLKWIERPFNTTIERDRGFLVDMANRIREKMYLAYRQYEIAVDVEECFELQRFCQCGQCSETYRGITLPSYMNTVEAAWFSREPITLYSKWRESKVGIRTDNDCMLASYDQPGFYPTERDLSPCGCADSIQFLSKNIADNGKLVRITYEDSSGDEQSEEVSLAAGAWMPISGMARYIKSVLLPTQLKGGVDIRQQQGNRLLSEYSPHESVPSYRRLKLTGMCDNSVVVIRASRKFTPLFWDHDIVETSNRDAIEECARHLFYANSGAEGGMIQKSEYHRSLFMESLKGEQSRDIGINRENSSSAMGPPIRRSRLRSSRRTFY